MNIVKKVERRVWNEFEGINEDFNLKDFENFKELVALTIKIYEEEKN